MKFSTLSLLAGLPMALSLPLSDYAKKAGLGAASDYSATSDYHSAKAARAVNEYKSGVPSTDYSTSDYQSDNAARAINEYESKARTVSDYSTSDYNSKHAARAINEYKPDAARASDYQSTESSDYN